MWLWHGMWLPYRYSVTALLLTVLNIQSTGALINELKIYSTGLLLTVLKIWSVIVLVISFDNKLCYNFLV